MNKAYEKLTKIHPGHLTTACKTIERNRLNWEALKEYLTTVANSSGELSSIAEHTWTTKQAQDTLKLMEALEQI